MEQFYYLALLDLKNVGNKTALKIISNVSDLEDFFSSNSKQLSGIVNNKKIEKSIANQINEIDIDKYKNQLVNLKNHNIKLSTIKDDNYPRKLLNIDNPPIILYYKGKLPDENAKSIAIIGTRKPTYNGINKTLEISKKLAENGYLIVSGLARGIDTFSHVGALDGKGTTIGVLGNGILQPYPEENINLIIDIVKKGCIISEYSADQKVNRYNLIDRNRITIGLSDIVLVVEGGKKSGTSHGVKFAKKQGKKIIILKQKDSTIPPSSLINELQYSGFQAIENANDILNIDITKINNKIRNTTIEDFN